MSVPSRRIVLLCLCIGALALLAGGIAVADTHVSDGTQMSEPQDNDLPSVIINVDNSTNYLSQPVQNVTQENHTRTSLDVSGAVQSDSLRLQGEHKQHEVAHLLETAGEGDAPERELLTVLERDVAAHEQEYVELFERYSDGRLDQSTFTRELLRLGVTGQQYIQLSEQVQNEGSPSDRVSLGYRNLNGELMMLPNPAVSQIDEDIRRSDSSLMYVQGGEDSLVLATVIDNRYVREAVILGERDRVSPEQFGADDRSEANDAFLRSNELYPWTMTDSFSPEIIGFGNTSVYRLEAAHSQGKLYSYLDGATTNPFYEVQEKNPLSVPVSDFTQRTDNGVRLSVESTAPTGPMRVDVQETGSSTENITLYIDDDAVGTVNGGGDIWTVQPRGTFEISAETEAGETVSVRIFQ